MWAERQDRWKGRPITTVSIGAQGQTLHGSLALPPGVETLPAVAKMVASPALAALIRQEPVVAARFPYPIVGTIGRAGLLGPNELRGYIGRQDDGDASAVAGFGAPNPLGEAPGVPWHRLAGLALFAVLPGAVVIWVSSRLSSERRDRTVGALRLVGLSRSQAAFVGVADSAASCAVGVVVAVLAMLLLRRSIDRLSFSGLRVFASDIQISPILTLLIGAAVFVGLSAVALASTRSRLRGVRLRSARPGDMVSALDLLLLVPLVCSFVGAKFLLTRYRSQSNPAFAELLPLMMFAGGAAVLAITPCVRVFGEAILRIAGGRQASVLIAGRRLVHDPDGFVRLGRYLTALVYVSLIGLIFIDQFTTDTRWTKERLRGDGNSALLVILDPSLQRPVETIGAMQTTIATLQVAYLPGFDQANEVLVGSCGSVARFVERPTVAQCGSRGIVLTLTNSDDAMYRPARNSSAETLSRIEQPVSPAFSTAVGGQLLVVPAEPLLAATVEGTGHESYVLVSTTRLEEARSAMMSLGSEMKVYPTGADFVLWAPDPGRRWLVAGLILALGLSLLGVVTASLDRVASVRRQARGLERLGAARRASVGAHVLAQGATLLVASLIGVMTGVTMAHVYRAGLTSEPVALEAASLTLIMSLIVSTVLTIITTPLTLARRIRPQP